MKMINKLSLFLVCMSLLLMVISCSQSDKILLADNGKSAYSIVLSESASPSEKFAADELQATLEKITTCKLPVVPMDQVSKEKRIFIGQSALTKSLMTDVDFSTIGDEEFIIRTVGNDLLIVGGKLRGTMYGTFSFLETYLGCRWYTNEIEIIPEKKTLSITTIHDRQKPAFEYRTAYSAHAFGKAWSVRQKMNGVNSEVTANEGGNIRFAKGIFGHSFNYLVPPEKYFKTHPEYYSLIKGKRVEQSQLCLTNPDVLHTVIKALDQWLTEDSTASVVTITQNDWDRYCECGNCKALDEREGSHSGTMIAFVNAVADSLKEKYPHVFFDTFAYTYTQIPPKTLTLHDNVLVRLCHMQPSCDAHPLQECERNAAYVSDLKTWRTKGGKIYVWHYVTNFTNYLMPFPNFNAIKKDFAFYKKEGVSGLFCQGNGESVGGEFAELRTYVLAKLLWNPTINVDSVINDFISRVYEDAAPSILAYFNMIHDLAKKPDMHMHLFNNPNEVGYLSPEVLDKADNYFFEAEKAVANKPEILKRVKRVHLPIYYARIWFQMRGILPTQSKDDIADPELLNTFKEIVTANDVNRYGEGRPMTAFLDPLINSISGENHFIRDLKIIGPFRAAGENPLKNLHSPEKEIAFDKTYEGLGSQKISWQTWSKDFGLYVDFLKAFAASKDSAGVAYAFCYVQSPKKFSTKIGVGSNDGVRIILNDRIIHDNPASRRAMINEDMVDATFQPGWNKLLVKVNQLGGDWGLYLNIVDPGKTLKYEIEKKE